MNTPRRRRLRPLLAALLITLASAALAPRASAQSSDDGAAAAPEPARIRAPHAPDVEHGRRLLEQGDAAGAEAVLRPAAERVRLDGDAWHLLGTAYARQGKQQDALKAFGTAVAVRLDRLSTAAVPNAERFVKLADDERAAVKEQALRRYAEARESVEAYLARQPADAAFWRTQLAALNAHAEYLAAALDKEFAGARADSQTARLVMLSKPNPGYTPEARRNGTGGRVRVRALFGADGKVTHPLAVRPLPHGLSEKAFEAARDISFQPAIVDGRPVSQFMTLEYGFAIEMRGPGPLLGPRTRPRIP